MVVTTKIGKLDLALQRVIPRVQVVQDDQYSRNIEMELYEEGAAWQLPSDASVAVSFKKPDGSGGLYETLPDGTACYTASGNVLTIALAPQVCTAPGKAQLSVLIRSGKSKLYTFPVCVEVNPNPGLKVVSEDYYKIAGSLADYGWEPGKVLTTDESGKVVAKDIKINGAASPIVCNETGTVISATDSDHAPLQGLKLYGKTTQDGTPTPENPVELESVGGDGNISVTVLGKNLFGGDALADKFVEQLSAKRDTNEKTISYVARNASDKTLFTNFKPNTQYTFIFKGMATDRHLNIRISYTDGTEATAWIFSEPDNLSTFLFVSNSTKSVERLKGTYNSGTTTLYYEECGIFEGVLTEADFEPYITEQTLTAQTPKYGLPGIGDVRDEIDFAKGVYVQKFNLVDLGTLNWGLTTYNGIHLLFCDSLVSAANCPGYTYANKLLCSHYPVIAATNGSTTDKAIYISNNGRVYVHDSAYSDANTFEEAMSGVWMLYELAEPIYHDLSAEELAQYAALHTNKPNTTVFNDSGAGMEIGYFADTKAYIDNKIAEMIEKTGKDLLEE